jgi:hypothetical protein
MKIGNKPATSKLAQEGKVYWQLSIGRNAAPHMYFEGGWRAFSFIVYKPYPKLEYGEHCVALQYKIKVEFAFWLPFYKI